MPGLNQLKQFNKDIQSLGDEVTIRASRGEKPVRVPIPRTVEDRDDSSDFELGMPEIAAPVDNSAVDDDLSDITGISTSSSAGSEEQAPSFEAPDMSSLLNPVVADTSDMGMPDLSMFMDAPAEEESEEEYVEEAPKEISIADMGLDALLSGAGFDGSEVDDLDEKPKANSDFYDDDDLDNYSAPVEQVDEIESEPEPLEEIPSEPAFKNPGAPLDIDSILNTKPAASPVKPVPVEPVVESAPIPDPFSFDEPLDIVTDDEVADIPEDVSDADSLESLDFDEKLDFNNSTFDDLSFDTPESEKATVNNTFNYYDDDDSLGFAMDDIPAAEEVTDDNVSDDSDSFDLPEDTDVSDGFDLPEDAGVSDDFDFASDAGGLEDFELPDESAFSDNFDLPEDAGSTDNFDLPEDAGSADDFDSLEFSSDAGVLDEFDVSEESSVTDNFDYPDNSGIVDNIGLTDDSGIVDNLSFPEESSGSDDFNLPEESSDSEDFSLPEDAGDSDGLDSLDLPEFGSDSDFGSDSNSDFPDDGDVFNSAFSDDSSIQTITSNTEDSIDAFTTENFEMGEEPSFDESISDDGYDYDNSDSDSESENFGEEALGDLDLSQMEGMSFPETDSNINSDGNFEMGSSDDFASESDFEIAGFTDVDVSESSSKNKKGPKLDEPNFTGALAGKDLPPNTLSDEQYKKFIENFKEYPLNVRVAFENFIVQDEFTDDAEFEIIEKILNKAPARQVAANLEKMMDISIPVPRDYEHRTAAEYEAYKKSIGYQLKNRIIPLALIGMVLLVLGWGIFNFTKYIIVIPAQAESLYKQGYALLQADEYPQSEIKFNQAAEKKLKKNWFFKYARGYREKKQYQRSSKMYENILKCFKHDKEAGLEYADMALNDLVDYERAEEIVRREVLDYHAGDEDARLLLGDIFLEWGTEKDPEKLELAKDQYMNLLDEAKKKELINLYNSRMMRYYIRTDNLASVLPYKDLFEPKEKSLAPEDWTELSGYLLKKLYGPMAPSEEYLRSKIEGLRNLLLRSVTLDSENPVAYYNIGNYYIQTNEIMNVESSLKDAINKFNEAPHLKNRDIYKYIDSYRLLGENYIKTDDILQAQESYSNGITLYTAEKESAGFKGNEDIGHLYSDLADINYFSAGDYKNAEMNYKSAIDLGYDNQKIRYRMGYIQYQDKNYQSALGSFIRAGEGSVKERNLLLSMGNTLSLRNDDYAAEGYYSQLIDKLNEEILNRGGGVFPQADKAEYDLMTAYLYAANNYGVTLHRLAERTGDSSRNSDAIVQFQQSERAWDALTRNQQTMVRLGGSNLAEENLKYVTHPDSTFEPSIYVEIPKTLTEHEGLIQ